MEKQYDFVIVGIQPWDIEIGSNCKNIAIEISKRNKVLYVNSPLDRISFLKNRNDAKTKKRTGIIKNKTLHIEQINPNLFVLTPNCLIESIQFLPFFLFKKMNVINNKRFANCIKEAINQLDFQQVILFNDSDMFRSFHLKELLNPILSIYYTRDQLMTVPYWKKHGRNIEPALIQKSDLILGNSPVLVENAKRYNKNAYYIGQGCEIESFLPEQEFKKPKEFESISGPIIGYVGLLTTRRLDIDLLYETANRQIDWNLILIGPEEDCFKSHKIHRLSNVYFFGNKPCDEIPNYIHFFDITINPQILNGLTISNYPRKIDEYLASGKPVVAIKTPTMEIFQDHVKLASNLNEFIQFIKESLNEDQAAIKSMNRISFAKTHTWEASINLMWNSINNLLNRKLCIPFI